jgi:DNA-binding ferritin-like protein (Dps family)
LSKSSNKYRKDAFNCFIEALKERRESIRMWENFLYLCLDLTDFPHAVTSLENLQILKWGKKKTMDYNSIETLINGTHQWSDSISEDDVTMRDIYSRLKARLGSVVHALAKEYSTEYEIWDALALFYQTDDNIKEEFEARESSYRAISQSVFGEKADVDENCFTLLAKNVISLMECTKIAEERAVDVKGSSVRMAVRSVIRRGKRAFPDNTLIDVLERLA